MARYSLGGPSQAHGANDSDNIGEERVPRHEVDPSQVCESRSADASSVGSV